MATAGVRVVAFYCLSAGSVTRRDLPRRLRHDTPDAIPIVVMGRLAVDAAFQGRGLGQGLLRDAILRTLTAAETIGVRALLVHALDDAAPFYRKYGFVSSPINERTLILPLETARAALP